MRIVTPQLKLDLRVDEAQVKDGKLMLSGMAGMLPCEATVSPQEIRKLARMFAKPAILKLLFSRAG